MLKKKKKTNLWLPKGWDREGGREMPRGRRYGDLCIRRADLLRYTAATNTPL